MVRFQDGLIHENKALHFYVDHPRITYELDALVKFGDRVKDRKPGVPVYHVSDVEARVRHWLIYEMNAAGGIKATFGGKNFAGFDRPFLDTLCKDLYQFSPHRCVDIGNLYMDKTDSRMPDLETCRTRALASNVFGKYIHNPVTHTALEDAVLCAELYSGWYDGLLGNPNNPTWRQG